MRAVVSHSEPAVGLFAAKLLFLQVLFALGIVSHILIGIPSPVLPGPGWASPALPSYVLFPMQAVVVVVQALVVLGVVRTTGIFARPSPAAGRLFRAFAWVYAGALLGRLFLSVASIMSSAAPASVEGYGAIAAAIFFHSVLAAWIFVLARFLERDGATVESSFLFPQES